MSTVSWKLSRAVERLAAAVRRDGPRGMLTETARLAGEFARVPVALAAEFLFDVRRGVRTRGFVRNESPLALLSVGGDGYHYQPIGLPLLRRLVATVPLERAATTFVDLGAGRGRAVILAAELGFGRVLGVELDPELATEGAENIRRWRARRRESSSRDHVVELVQGDAATCSLPKAPLLIAIFNSFGPTTLRLLLDRLCDGRIGGDDSVFVAYINPVHKEVFEELPRLVPHSRAPAWTVYRLEPTGA